MTLQELNSAIKAYFVNHPCGTLVDVDITKSRGKNPRQNFLEIEVTHEYDWYSGVKCDQSFRDFLAPLIGVEDKDIDHFDDIAEMGCPTCDFNSNYGFVARVHNIPEDFWAKVESL